MPVYPGALGVQDPFEGHAVLSGALICGRCGRRMRAIYSAKDGDHWI
jgi:hypothetical protein